MKKAQRHKGRKKIEAQKYLSFFTQFLKPRPSPFDGIFEGRGFWTFTSAFVPFPS